MGVSLTACVEDIAQIVLHFLYFGVQAGCPIEPSQAGQSGRSSPS